MRSFSIPIKPKTRGYGVVNLKHYISESVFRCENWNMAVRGTSLEACTNRLKELSAPEHKTFDAIFPISFLHQLVGLCLFVQSVTQVQTGSAEKTVRLFLLRR